MMDDDIEKINKAGYSVGVEQAKKRKKPYEKSSLGYWKIYAKPLNRKSSKKTVAVFDDDIGEGLEKLVKKLDNKKKRPVKDEDLY